MKLLLSLFSLAIPPLSAERSVELFVALCDNKTQSIVPVGAKIGNGDDHHGNLYWGCSDGARSYFKNSKKWTLLSSEEPAVAHILETLHFKHKRTGTILTAHAYRGSQMKKCLEDYFQALKSGGPNRLIAFIGHNGLMDTSPELPQRDDNDLAQTPTVVLSCLSQRLFEPHLTKFQARPLILTTQLMYPGAFILHDVIEVWFNQGTPDQYLNAAAKAYAKNQKISPKAARGIFASPLPSS